MLLDPCHYIVSGSGSGTPHLCWLDKSRTVTAATIHGGVEDRLEGTERQNIQISYLWFTCHLRMTYEWLTCELRVPAC